MIFKNILYDFFLIFTLIFSIITHSADASQEIVMIDDNGDRYSVGNQIKYVKDKKGDKSITDILPVLLTGNSMRRTTLLLAIRCRFIGLIWLLIIKARETRNGILSSITPVLILQKYMYPMKPGIIK